MPRILLSLFNASSSKFDVPRVQPLHSALWRRTTTSLSEISSHKLLTKEFIQANEPKNLRKVKTVEQAPISDLPAHFHAQLNKAHSNPRSILKLYQEYIRTDSYPAYEWIVRCFCQLAHTFGFNSFWSTSDKQSVQSIKAFKYLVYDLIERQSSIKKQYVPRLLYSLAALEYRSWQLLPQLLQHIEDNIGQWRTPTIANMILNLSLLGIFNIQDGTTQFGQEGSMSKDYGGCILTLINEMQKRIFDADGTEECTPFDWCGVAFAMTLANLYEYPTAETSPIADILQRACNKLTLENLEHSGWVQFFLYLILYCTDVENPANSEAIKGAIPLSMQESLHTRWLQDIVLKGQPQGSEILQQESDKVLHKLRELDALINCSVGRPWDEQHCWFVGHLIRSRNLAIEYDYLLPLGPGRPRASGWLQCKRRLINKFGIHVVTIHKCFWDCLTDEQKLLELTSVLANFTKLKTDNETHQPKFEADVNTRYMKHRRKRFETWPPEKIEV